MKMEATGRRASGRAEDGSEAASARRAPHHAGPSSGATAGGVHAAEETPTGAEPRRGKRQHALRVDENARAPHGAGGPNPAH